MPIQILTQPLKTDTVFSPQKKKKKTDTVFVRGLIWTRRRGPNTGAGHPTLAPAPPPNVRSAFLKSLPNIHDNLVASAKTCMT